MGDVRQGRNRTLKFKAKQLTRKKDAKAVRLASYFNKFSCLAYRGKPAELKPI